MPHSTAHTKDRRDTEDTEDTGQIGGFFFSGCPSKQILGQETMRNVGDNKPNHYGYDNAAKKMDPVGEPERTPLERRCPRRT
ncbi:GL14476 [Drosophila persimilis]|uniref:GL14476 n=1 Tax=Drosophila persimilis TaxID=7234 RepID=B4IS22_DROPE|nr:GL14476 [Drosophila persimilis]